MRTLKSLGVNRDSSDPTNYPHDRIKNDTVPGDGSGTPYTEATGGNGDVENAMLVILDEESVVPNNSPEIPSSSQIKEALDSRYGVYVLSCTYSGGNIVTSQTAGLALSQSITPTTYNSINNRYTMNLNIATAGNYIVTISLAANPYIDGATETHPIVAVVAHDNPGTGNFLNNTVGNISISPGRIAGTIAEAAFQTPAVTSFILTIYRV